MKACAVGAASLGIFPREGARLRRAGILQH